MVTIFDVWVEVFRSDGLFVEISNLLKGNKHALKINEEVVYSIRLDDI